jgi:hypothetical protein
MALAILVAYSNLMELMKRERSRLARPKEDERGMPAPKYHTTPIPT